MPKNTKKDQKEVHKDIKDTGTTDTDLQGEIEQLQKKLSEQEEITKRAQSDYFRLKMDMDSYIKRAEEAKKTEKIDALVHMGSKLLPFLTQLKQSIDHMPEHIASDTWSEGLQLMYKKALGDVASLGITQISTEVGMDPDLTLHMPINMQDTEDDDLKGKIIQVIEGGRQYEKDGVVKVITPSKIVVGS